METTTNTNPTQGTSNGTSQQAAPAATMVADNKSYLCTVQCAIRRKPNLIGLPGQDPAERIYRIGASLDGRTKGNLKGISGELEIKFMPEVVGISANDPGFRRAIEEYWSSIGKAVPADEPFLRDHEKGIKLSLEFRVIGKAKKEQFDAILKVEEKMETLNKWLVTTVGKETNNPLPVAVLDHDSISDYLLLNYCLKYSKVANSFEDIDKSPKIDFYIFEKAVSVKNQLSVIDLRQKAMSLYQDLDGNDRKIDAILLMFEEDLSNFDNQVDKLLRIDELYNAAPLDNMKKFVAYAQDEAWETKYLVKLAIKLNKLRNPVNTNAIYYGDVLIGTSLEDSVLFLNNDVKGKEIKTVLLKETQAK